MCHPEALSENEVGLGFCQRAARDPEELEKLFRAVAGCALGDVGGN